MKPADNICPACGREKDEFDDVMTAEQAALEIGCSVSTLYRLVKGAQIQRHRVRGRAFFDGSDVRRLIRERDRRQHQPK